MARLCWLLFLAGSLVWADPATGRVDRLFAPYDKPDSPGCALGVIRDGGLIYARGYGMANLDYRIPITPRSIFDIGSSSKQFAAMSLLLLEEEGKLSIDDDIRKYLPEMPAYQKPITIRDLIHHTSGIRDYLTLFTLAGYGPDDFYTDDDVLRMLARQKELNFTPGDDFLYSNSGYFLISLIVKRASGKTLGEYARERIFQPLGMTHTHYHNDHTEIVPDRATGYAPRRGGGFRIDMSTLDMIGDGGIYTSVEDLARWDENFYSKKVGGPKLLARMYRHGMLNDGRLLDYASALTIDTYKGLTIVTHGGAWAGFRAELLRFPDQRFSVICLCNLATARPTRMARQVAEIYLGSLMKPGEEEPHRRPGESASPAQTVKLSPAQLGLYQGRYFSEELQTTYELKLDDGRLCLHRKNAPPHSLDPAGSDEFHDGGLQFHFQREKGSVSGFRLDAGRVRNLMFRRVP